MRWIGCIVLLSIHFSTFPGNAQAGITWLEPLQLVGSGNGVQQIQMSSENDIESIYGNTVARKRIRNNEVESLSYGGASFYRQFELSGSPQGWLLELEITRFESFSFYPDLLFGTYGVHSFGFEIGNVENTRVYRYRTWSIIGESLGSAERAAVTLSDGVYGLRGWVENEFDFFRGLVPLIGDIDAHSPFRFSGTIRAQAVPEPVAVHHFLIGFVALSLISFVNRRRQCLIATTLIYIDRCRSY